MARNQSLRIASQYLLARLGPSLQVPSWVITKVAFAPNENYQEAKYSVNAMIAKALALLAKEMGETYSFGVSESKGVTYYFFSGKHHLDAFSLALSTPQDETKLTLGYVPYDLHHRPDLHKQVEVKITADPMAAGVAMMRGFRQLLGDMKRRKLIATPNQIVRVS
jgi:hypothetical protein